jgi:hypothetical protein
MHKGAAGRTVSRRQQQVVIVSSDTTASWLWVLPPGIFGNATLRSCAAPCAVGSKTPGFLFGWRSRGSLAVWAAPIQQNDLLQLVRRKKNAKVFVRSVFFCERGAADSPQFPDSFYVTKNAGRPNRLHPTHNPRVTLKFPHE